MRESGFRAPSLTWSFGPPGYLLSVVMFAESKHLRLSFVRKPFNMKSAYIGEAADTPAVTFYVLPNSPRPARKALQSCRFRIGKGKVSRNAIVAIRVRPTCIVFSGLYALVGLGAFIQYCFLEEMQQFTIPVGIIAPFVHFNINLNLPRSMTASAPVVYAIAAVFAMRSQAL